MFKHPSVSIALALIQGRAVLQLASRAPTQNPLKGTQPSISRCCGTHAQAWNDFAQQLGYHSSDPVGEMLNGVPADTLKTVRVNKQNRSVGQLATSYLAV